MSESLSRPRRRPATPAFDPTSAPWQSADKGLTAIAQDQLVTDRLRSILISDQSWVEDPLGLTEYRHPGREGDPVLAAVLIPLVTRPEGVSIMLTKRTAHLHDHAGQVSFPGGRVEDSDGSPLVTAVRETEEETGLSQRYIELLNTMPVYTTSTGFAITPVLSFVTPGFTLKPDSFEVAEVFEVPLSFLMNPANHRLYCATLPDGRIRQYYAMSWQNYFIWGATAGMLRNLYHLIRHRLALR